MHLCSFCKEPFLTKTGLNLHCQLHAGNSEFLCFVCKKTFRDLDQLKLHDLHHSIVEAQETEEHLLEGSHLEESSIYKYMTFPDPPRYIEQVLLQCMKTDQSAMKFYVFNKGEKQLKILTFGHQNKCYRREDVPSNEEDKKSNILLSMKNVSASKEGLYVCDICEKTYCSAANKHYGNRLCKKQYTCTVCKKCFVQMQTLQRHTHETLKYKYTCDYCDKSFFNRTLLLQHILLFHDKTKRYVCNTCKRHFRFKTELVRHCSIHATTYPALKAFVCKKNNKKLAIKSHLTKHMWQYLSLKLFSCNICGKTFTKCSLLQRHCILHDEAKRTTSNPIVHYIHQVNVKNKNTNFNNCKGTSNKQKSIAHKRKVSDCYICEASCSTRKSFREHFLLFHKSVPINSCHICFKQFRKASQVHRHLISHTGEKNFTCYKCNKKFCTDATLKRHIEHHTKFQRIKCNKCERTFADASYLKKHILTHKKEIKYKFECGICDEVFTEEKFLNKHQLWFHDASKQFQCNVCQRRFTYKYYLNRHMQSHTGTKSYKCFKCNRMYGNKSDLLRHSWSHIGLKPFFCKICGKGFTRNNNLQKHLSSHKQKGFAVCI